MSRKPTTNIDYTSRDYEAFRELMIQKLQEKMPEYTDTSQTDAGIVILECLANGLDILSLYNDVIANDVLLPTTQDRKMACILAKNLGYTPYNQTASITPMVFVLNNTKDSDTVISRGTRVSTVAENNQTPMYFETVKDLTIPKGALGNEQDEEGNYLYTVDVEHGVTIKNDLLGTSLGTPYQQFKLTHKGVIPDSINLYVDEGDGSKLWKQVPTFLDSDIHSSSKVYTVTIDEFDNCYIDFGENVHGKIPTRFENGITATYRVGGGVIGNVQANSITELITSIGAVDSVFNPKSSTTLGHDKETIEEIRYNAPASFRTRNRAVTLQDYSDLLHITNHDEFYGIFNSIAVRDADILTKANLYYQMREGYEMTPTLFTQIFEFFRTRIMIGTSLEVFPYEPQVIDLEATIIIDRDYSRKETVDSVTDYIRNTFFKFGEFSFGDEFVKSDLEGDIRYNFEGVRSFRITSPLDDIITPNSPKNIIELGNITLDIVGGAEDE